MKANSILRRGIAAIGWLLLAYLLVWHVREITKFHTWTNSGFRESQLAQISDKPAVVVFQSVVPMDFDAAPHPVARDTVIAINDTSAPTRLVPPGFGGMMPPLPAGRPLPMTFVHSGDTLRTAFAMNPPSWPLV